MLQQDYFENYADGLNISKMLAMRVKKTYLISEILK
jgi:hypothetical protein